MRDYDATVKNLREAAKGLLFDAMPYRASVMKDAADAIEELLAENKAIKQSNKDAAMRNKLLCDEISRMKEKVPKWVSVEERLPEEWRAVLAYSPIHSDEKNPHMIQICWYIGYGKWRETEYGEIVEIPVTHWMPLPTPPKGVE